MTLYILDVGYDEKEKGKVRDKDGNVQITRSSLHELMELPY
jgi:hypothetical protein